jgi:hypothetical protein
LSLSLSDVPIQLEYTMAKFRPSPTYDLILPSFKARCDLLIERMAARGWEAVPISGLRTPAQAAANAAKGTGITNSLHCFGAAVDWVHAHDGWDNPRFYKVLEEEAIGLGLVSGARWKKPDRPHVQCCAVGRQNEIRRLGMGPESFGARDAVCQRLMKPIKPRA